VISRGTLARDVHAEHTAIFEAALARDHKRAAEAIERHIMLTFESIRLLMPEAAQGQ
jgi:GntR family transcriptional regulator, carbon starvation induced regulator